MTVGADRSRQPEVESRLSIRLSTALVATMIELYYMDRRARVLRAFRSTKRKIRSEIKHGQQPLLRRIGDRRDGGGHGRAGARAQAGEAVVSASIRDSAPGLF